jgi:phosphatidate phosphatase APP1
MHTQIMSIKRWPGRLLSWLLVGSAATLSLSACANSDLVTNLKTDETVLLFPTNAIFDPQNNRWQLNIHGWVFEPERDSLVRNGLIKSLAQLVDADDDTAEGKRFARRTAMFLVDNEGDKNIVLSAAGQNFAAPTTGPNGHFQFTASLPSGKSRCKDWLTVKVKTNKGDKRQLSGQVQCLANAGISVISDIDDTIKDSNVLDKKALMQNTFLKKFRAVQGMSTLYQKWHQQGYQFHYVSSSPWQLYPALSTFIDDQSFPRGSMHLKLIRVKDESIHNLFATPEQGKIPVIKELLNSYPQRRFILVGDSGEKDPDIYARLARQYPDRIVKIYIHNVTNDKARIATIFKGLPRRQWLIFTNANEILQHQALLTPNN